MLIYQPWKRYTLVVFFKFFPDSLNMKIILRITFSGLKNKSMDKDYWLSFYLFWGVVKTRQKILHITHTSIYLSCLLKHQMDSKEGGGGNELTYGNCPLIHHWTWHMFASMYYSWVIHFLWVIPFLSFIILCQLVTLLVTHIECFGHKFTIFMVFGELKFPT